MYPDAFFLEKGEIIVMIEINNRFDLGDKVFVITRDKNKR